MIQPIDPKAIPKARVPKRRARYCPRRDEVVALIIAASLDWRKRDRWLVYLTAATTGLRMNTLRRLRWEHITSFDGCACLDLPAAIVKNRTDTRVWLTRECHERLMMHRQSGGGRDGFVFARIPKLASFDRDLKAAGLAKRPGAGGSSFALHSLRHFASMYLASADAFGLEERQRQMGHETEAMTRSVYTDQNHEALGKKIWSLQPLLPSEFTGNRGRRTGEIGPQRFDPGRSDGRNVGSQARNANDPDPDTTPPLAPRNGSLSGDFGSFDGPRGGLALGSEHREISRVGLPGHENVVGGSNPPTPISRQKHHDPNVVPNAMADLVVAQAALIRELLQELRDGDHTARGKDSGTHPA